MKGLPVRHTVSRWFVRVPRLLRVCIARRKVFQTARSPRNITLGSGTCIRTLGGFDARLSKACASARSQFSQHYSPIGFGQRP